MPHSIQRLTRCTLAVNGLGHIEVLPREIANHRKCFEVAMHLAQGIQVQEVEAAVSRLGRSREAEVYTLLRIPGSLVLQLLVPEGEPSVPAVLRRLADILEAV